MTFLDYLILAILVVSTLTAFLKGFMRELISLASVLLGFAVAVLFYPRAAAWFAEYARTAAVANFLGFMILFLGGIAAGMAVSWLVNRFLEAARLKGIDRLLGGVFGFVRGWLIGAVLFLALTAFPFRLDSVERSTLAPYLLSAARVVVWVASSDVKGKFHEGYARVREFWVEDSAPIRP